MGVRNLLVLDLDGSLVYSTEESNPEADFCIGTRTNGYHVQKRPHLDAFLAAVVPSYDLFVWTSGAEEYCRAVVRGDEDRYG